MRVPRTVTARIFNIPLNELPPHPTDTHVVEEVTLTFHDFGNGAVYLDGPDGEQIGSVERFTLAQGASFTGWVARVDRDYTSTVGLSKAEALHELTTLAEEHLNARITTKDGRRLSLRFAAANVRIAANGGER